MPSIYRWSCKQCQALINGRLGGRVCHVELTDYDFNHMSATPCGCVLGIREKGYWKAERVFPAFIPGTVPEVNPLFVDAVKAGVSDDLLKTIPAFKQPASGRISCKEPHFSPGPTREESRVIHVEATGDALLDAMNKHPDAVLHLTKRQIRQLSIAVAKQALAEKRVCYGGVSIKSEAGELAVELTKGSTGQKFVADVAKEAYGQLIRAVEEKLSDTVKGPYLDVLVAALRRKAEDLGKDTREKSLEEKSLIKMLAQGLAARDVAILNKVVPGVSDAERAARVSRWVELLSALLPPELHALIALYEDVVKKNPEAEHGSR